MRDCIGSVACTIGGLLVAPQTNRVADLSEYFGNRKASYGNIVKQWRYSTANTIDEFIFKTACI